MVLLEGRLEPLSGHGSFQVYEENPNGRAGPPFGRFPGRNKNPAC